MIDQILQRKLENVVEMERSIRQRWVMAGLLALAVLAAAGIALLKPGLPGSPIQWSMVLLLAIGLGGLVIGRLTGRHGPAAHDLATRIESTHPELQAALLTAVEQKPGEGGQWSYLQEQLFEEVVRHAVRNDWSQSMGQRRLQASTRLLWIMFALALAANFWMVKVSGRPGSSKDEIAATEEAEEQKTGPQYEISVTPGDVEVEKGARLVVEARFAKDVPADAQVIVSDEDGKERERISMRQTVDQHVFGGLIPRIDSPGKYRVVFSGMNSDEYAIATYVHPELERADAHIKPPAYSGQPEKDIKNTLKVTALEGSEIGFQFKINKPVAAAELFGEDKTIIPLKPKEGDPTTLTCEMQPDKTLKYRLHLVDDKERSNKQPPWITVNIVSNQPPKIEVAFPKRDIQVSAIQELPIEAKVWDDLGVRKAGAYFSLGGKSREVMLTDQPLAAGKKHDLKSVFNLEDESAKPRQLVSYYFWAEDQGPKGEVRRSMSDMFFADVRHFEDIFREMEPPPPSEQQGQQGSQTDQLVNLQKQVVNATWRIFRDTSSGRSMDKAAADVEVVSESEGIVLDKIKESMEKVEDAEIKTALTEAWKSAKDAIAPLDQAAEEKTRAPLNQALGFEQSSLEWLFRAQSREHQVMRQSSKSRSSGQQQASQRQLMNLELKQKDQRYEEEKQASEEQSAEQKENLQVLNRLKELARRQEALAEKMKQLEEQMAKAETEEEKQELANQLKRLQDEQEQLLRDLDDLKERMERPENQESMAEARQQLDQSREQVLDALDQLKQEQLANAANSGTRAQRQLDEIQEEFRQKTSRRFSDEMRQMRDQAKEMAEQQKKIADALENNLDARNDAGEKTQDTTSSLQQMLDGSQVARAIDEQRERINRMMEDMRGVSEQAEGVEPLLSRSLYEAIRNAHTSGLDENMEESRDYARIGDRPRSQEAERKATKAVEDLQKGVEKAAESVLGSESDALRMARTELDSLLKDIEENQEGENGNTAQSDAQKGKPGENGQASERSQSGAKGRQDAESRQASAGRDEQKDANDAKGNSKEMAEGTPSESKGEGEGKGQTAQRNPKGAGKAQSKSGQPGQGTQPGEQGENPEGRPQGQLAGNQPQEGSQPSGNSDNPSEQPGEAEGQSRQGENGSKGEAKGSRQASRGGEGQGQDGQESQPEQPGRQGQPVQRSLAANAGSRAGGDGGAGGNRSGDDRRSQLIPNGGGSGWFFDEPVEREDVNPLTGAGYEDWTDRLRNVEEMLNQPELRNEASRVLDNARAIRIDSRRNNLPPQREHIQSRITQPLVELRDRVAEELLKRDAENPLSPVDRDPVPQRYRDLVRKYYTELGTGK